MLTKAEAASVLGIQVATLASWVEYDLVKRLAYNGLRVPLMTARIPAGR